MTRSRLSRRNGRRLAHLLYQIQRSCSRHRNINNNNNNLRRRTKFILSTLFIHYNRLSPTLENSPRSRCSLRLRALGRRTKPHTARTKAKPTTTIATETDANLTPGAAARETGRYRVKKLLPQEGTTGLITPSAVTATFTRPFPLRHPFRRTYGRLRWHTHGRSRRHTHVPSSVPRLGFIRPKTVNAAQSTATEARNARLLKRKNPTWFFLVRTVGLIISRNSIIYKTNASSEGVIAPYSIPPRSRAKN